MFKNNKLLVVLALIAFLVGILIGRDRADFKTEEVTKVPASAISQKAESSSGLVTTLPVESQDDFALFVKRLEGNLSANEYDKLFDEVFTSRSAQSVFNISSDKKMAMLLEKWGESSPRVALEKIVSAGGHRDLARSVFRGWARKDPEAAVAFFEESQNHPLVGKNSDLVFTIATSWAEFAPEKSWNWLQLQNGKTVSGMNFQQCRDFVILQAITKQPKQFSSFMEKLDDADFQRNAHNMGIVLAEKGEEFAQLLKKLTPESQIKAEAGKIVSLSKGELEKVKEQLSSFDEEKRLKLVGELAPFLLNKTCLDMNDRIDWVVEKLPEEKWPDYEISKWLRDDREGAQAWLESLPAGKKKEKLQQLFAK